ncbi:MAG: PD40 domain-containing protein [Acidobacteriaceae bacterium]|nr:PD40 domain-containing protein [Acidobacteriaceae bacterium]
MTSEDWRTAWELYNSARELPAGQRAVLFDSIDTDPEVLQEVISLLEQPEEPPPETEGEDKAPLASFDMDRYTVLECLGKGGMSEVYSARDQQLGRIVALKFLLPGTIGSRSAERVMREAKVLSGFNHPNIVTVYEVIQSAAGLAIVMELVEGAALRSICGSPLPEEQVLQLGQQTAQALAAAHAHGIVHRDIKPENILLRPDGYVKVVDFGLARQVAADDSTYVYGLTMGTLRYMSPEQVRGESISPASDIFSLGLVLYELATGAHPFTADSSIQTAYSIATKRAAAFSNTKDHIISSRLEQLIFAMLAKDPAERPSAANVAKELGNILLAGKLATTVADSRKHGKRRFWLPALVACLVGITAATWFVHSRRETPPLGDLKIEPLTSQSGWELTPALSPDGQSVAFTWSEKLDGATNIYLKHLSEDNPIKLTNDPECLIGYLAWSPDSKRIAFKCAKGHGESGGSIFSIPASGGKADKLFDLVNADLSSSIDWSPDGTELAFSDVLPGTARVALYLLNLRVGKTRRLTSPPAGNWGDWSPRFSPDGSTIAFKRVTGFWLDDLYLVARHGGATRRLTATQRGIWGHTWWPDGKSLIVSCQRTGSIFGIWRFSLKPNLPPERISLGGTDAITPTASLKANRIAWVDQLWDLNIYRISATGTGTPAKLIASTLRDQGATYSPDGRIAFISDRSGSREIWLANPDGSGQVRVTNLKGPQIDHLSWSPDGRQLAFESRIAGHLGLFALPCTATGLSCGEPKRLTPEDASESPAWSRDGRFLYFASSRSGRWEVCKQPVLGGRVTQVTHQGGYMSSESLDGKWLYFSKHGIEAIYRQQLIESDSQAHSDAELVIGSPYHVQSAGWALTRKEIIFIDRATRDHPAVIRAFNPETKAMRSILFLNELFPDHPDIGLAVSPDEKWILYSQLDRSGSNIMVAESRQEK